MPAPAVTALAIITGVGAALAFKVFVYDPHIAPQVELWKEEFLARRRARQQQRQQQQRGPVPIPMRRRRNSDSDSDSSDDDDDESTAFTRPGTGSGWGDNVSSTGVSGNMGKMRRRQGTNNVSGDGPIEDLVASEISEWREQVQSSRPSGSGTGGSAGYAVRHPSNRGKNEAVPHSPLSTQPTHVLFDSSVPTTPSTTVPSRLPSPPPQVSPWQTTNSQISSPRSQSTINSNWNGNKGSYTTPPNLSSQSQSVPLPQVASPSRAPAPLGRSSNPFTPTLPSHHHVAAYMTPESPSREFRELTPEMNQINGPRGPLVSARSPEPYLLQSPFTPTSPIPSLSQSYPQEADHEIGVELVSPPSSSGSDSSSPFMAFSPFMAPQELVSLSQFTSQSPSQQLQPQQQQARVISPFESWSNVTSPAFATVSLPAPTDHPTHSRTLSPSSITTPTISMSNYQSFPTSPVLSASGLDRRSPSPVSPTSPFTFPSRVNSDEDELSYLSSPSPINFYQSPNPNLNGSGSGSGNTNASVEDRQLGDVLSPRSPHSDFDIDVSDSDFDFDVLSDQGSNSGSGSDESWTGVHSNSSGSQGRTRR